MKHTLTIAQRELAALFHSATAYLVLAIFSLLSSLAFMVIFIPGDQAQMGTLFYWLLFLLIFFVPAISMRLVSEELRSGTIELLMTAPISDAQVIAGKWIGAMLFLVTLLIPIGLQLLVLEFHADPDYGPIFTGILGLLLVAGLYLAIGLFVSTITSSQLISFLITVLIIGLPTISMAFLFNADWMPDTARNVLSFIYIPHQYEDFARGLIDLRKVIYFASGIALFLFFGIKLLESRRWR